MTVGQEENGKRDKSDNVEENWRRFAIQTKVQARGGIMDRSMSLKEKKNYNSY